MKKSKIVTSAVLAAVLAVTPAALAGCSGDHYSKISFAAQDTSYVVTSQGGSAVQYGNYVYFINGTRGYDDSKGTANVWDNVVKGALYRAELSGKKETDKDGHNVFKPQSDENAIEFKYEIGEDYFGKEQFNVKTTKIAPKTVGTSGYANGGIFIYDNAVFFATPNNEKNSTGAVQTTRTDFFMMPLSGGSPTRVYTTSEKIDTTASAYAFYKHKGYVYLVVAEGSNIVSVKIDPGKEKADEPVTFKVGATSVYFPVRDTYYKGISSNTVEDFIYFVRPVGEKDKQRAGTVIEAMRPDGNKEENFVVSMSGETETIEGVRNGVFFYRTNNSEGNAVIAYTNLHNQLMQYSKSYRTEQSKLPEDKRNKHIASDETGNGNRFPTEVGSFTSTYAFRADEESNVLYFVGVTSGEISLYTNSVAQPLVGTLCKTTGTPQFIKDGYLYFSGSSSDYYRVPLFENMDGYGKEEKLAENTSSAGISCDYAAGYFTYFGKVDEWANGYSMFLKVDGVRNVVVNNGEEEYAPAQFVGRLIDADKPTQEQIDAATPSAE